MLQGFPIAADLPDDPGFGERFWYWRGASGRAYIHSIYRASEPLPAATGVWVLVRNEGGLRRALAVSGFARPVACASAQGWGTVEAARADEIHVHLLARSAEAAALVCADLEEALLAEAPA